MLHVTYKMAIVAWPYHRIGEVTLHYVYYKDDEDPGAVKFLIAEFADCSKLSA